MTIADDEMYERIHADYKAVLLERNSLRYLLAESQAHCEAMRKSLLLVQEWSDGGAQFWEVAQSVRDALSSTPTAALDQAIREAREDERRKILREAQGWAVQCARLHTPIRSHEDCLSEYGEGARDAMKGFMDSFRGEMVRLREAKSVKSK